MLIQKLLPVKNRKIAGWLLAIFGTFFIIAAKYQESSLHAVPVTHSAHKAVIFDLGNVLFTTSSQAKTSVFLPTILKNPTLLYYLIGFQAKEEFFKILHKVPAKTKEPMYIEGKLMPQIMVDWQTAALNCHTIKLAVQHQIDQETQYPQAIKNLFYAIAQLMFDPQTLASSQIPIEPMVKVAKKLKRAGYKLYALSNWDPESFKVLQKNNPAIFKMFDGILISGDEKIGKPNLEFYSRLLKKHDLTSTQCIFIDDEPENVKAAEQLGITSIVCDQTTSAVKGLIKQGVLTLQP